jgi:hypothetical protein
MAVSTLDLLTHLFIFWFLVCWGLNSGPHTWLVLIAHQQA